MAKKVKQGLAILFLLFLNISATCSASSPQPFLPNSTLTLEDVIAVALSHQPQLKSAEQNVKAALSRGSQHTADYYPQIAFDSTYQRGNSLQITGPVSDLLTAAFLTYTSNFTASLVVEDFGKRFALVGEAKAQAEEAAAQYHDARSKVIFDAAQAYFKVLQTQSLLDVSEKLERASEKHLEQAKGFVRTGEKPKLDLLTAQAAYLSHHFNYLKAKQDLANAQSQLNTSMGISDPPAYQVKEDLAIPPFDVDLAGAKALAFKIKPQLQLARAKVKELQAKANEIKAERWPIVTANALYGWIDTKFPPGTQSWLLGMALHWPLFDGNKLTHQINEAVYLEQQGEEDEKSVRLQIEQDVEQSYRALESAKEQMEVAKEEAAQAEEASRLADDRYKVGLAAFLEVADAQAKLAQAKDHEVEALTSYRLSQSALKRSMGIEEP